MAIDRQYFVDEMMPNLRKELPSSVQLPLRKLPAGQSYGQHVDKAAMAKYLDSILPNSVKLSPSRIAAPNAGMYALPERVGLLSAVPGRPDTDVNAVPPSAELMSNTEVTAPPPSAELMSNTPRDALRVGMGAGETVARDQEEAGSLSGLLGNFDWRKLIAILARPEFQQPGVSPLTAFTNATFAQGQAEIAGAREQAKLDQAAEQTALENEYRRTRDSRDAERLIIAQENAKRERLKAPTITKAKIEAFTALAGTDKVTRDIINDLYNTGYGRFIGYETLGGGQGASKEDTQAAVAAEAISIQNANPRMSPIEAVREAAKRLQAKASGSALVPAPAGTDDVTAYLEANRKSKSKKVN